MPDSFSNAKPAAPSLQPPGEIMPGPATAPGDLAENQQYLDAVLATSQAGILIIDADTHRIVEANPRAVELIGAPKEKVIGSVCHTFICAAEIGQCPITDLGQDIDCCEREVITAQGDCIAVVKTATRVSLGGRPYLVESFLDLSDRKRAEAALKESEERYLDILDNANDLIQSVDPNGAFIYVNRAWKRTLGYSDAEIAALNVFDVIGPACRDHCSLLFREIMQGKSIPLVDVQFVAKDGRLVALEGSINCSFVDGRPALTRGIFRDITERNHMARELQQSEERYRMLVEHAPEAIFVHSGGKFLYANHEAARLFGAGTPEELVGRQALSFIHPDYREPLDRELQQMQKSGAGVARLETKVLRLDGAVIDVESVGTSVSWEGRPAIQVYLRDTSELKKIEQEREQWQRKLEQKVAEKTRHLKAAQAKLIQSEKMATLGEVISGASHELNNPLAGILSAIQLLRRSALAHPIDPDLMEGIDVLESIESATIRCQKIVEDLIRFSTQTRCDFSPMDLNEVLKDSLEVTGDQYARAGIRIDWKPGADLPTIEGDFVKLLEVFTNILENARSAVADQGVVGITTRLVNRYAETPKVVICIRDTGCGIPQQNLGKIFDPFFTTKPPGRGPGLGLTVSYGIIKRHHGEIDVHSVVGKGTEVTVTLPVRQPAR